MFFITIQIEGIDVFENTLKHLIQLKRKSSTETSDRTVYKGYKHCRSGPLDNLTFKTLSTW